MSLIASWSCAGTGPGRFDMPWDVAVDIQDNVYVSDCRNYRIPVFEGNSTILYPWRSGRNGFGEFSHPAVIAFDETQKL